MLNGILNLDKPRGMTSHDAVAAVRRIIGIRAVGHTGTLDPEASGILVLCLGSATKFARFFETLEKTYWTVIQLGLCTDTQDATGTVTRQCEVPPLTHAQLRNVLDRFQGPLQQIPPMYSAVKYRGQRLYHLARQGQTVARQARAIFVRHLEMHHWIFFHSSHLLRSLYTQNFFHSFPMRQLIDQLVQVADVLHRWLFDVFHSDTTDHPLD